MNWVGLVLLDSPVLNVQIQSSFPRQHVSETDKQTEIS